MNSNKSLGARGEDAAAAYLVQRGWTVLERNWRCSEGELDIVAHDGLRHVVVEVKTRSSTDYGDPFDAISRQKAIRLRLLAWRWAAANGMRGAEVGVDVLGLVTDRSGFTIDHLREVC